MGWSPRIPGLPEERVAGEACPRAIGDPVHVVKVERRVGRLMGYDKELQTVYWLGEWCLGLVVFWPRLS